MTTTPAHSSPPAVAWSGSEDPNAPLVVLLHGRGASEASMIGLADHLPVGPAYAAVRAPIAEGGGYAWFANRGIGRPITESLCQQMDWFSAWLDEVASNGRPVVLIGFSGGAAFAGGLVLDDPARYTGTAVLYGTIPFDAGVPVTPGHLAGTNVLVIHGQHDRVIPHDLLERTWTYLTGDSAANTTAVSDPSGHELTPSALAALQQWLTNTLAPTTQPKEVI